MLNSIVSRTSGLVLATVLVLAVSPTWAEVQNDRIGFATNHIFDSAMAGENIDVLSGNLNLEIPIGPRYQLSERLSYGVTLYYNAKIWEHDCRNLIPGQDCEGKLVAPNDYGIGFRLSFGRIYQDSRDRTNVYRYQAPSGAEHFFECLSSSTCTTPKTVDGSSIAVTRVATNQWEVWPGNGTKITIDHVGPNGQNDVGRNGWHATRVESVSNPSVGYDIAYDFPSGNASIRIDKITDSSGRVIDFTHQGGDDGYIAIEFPGFAASESYAEQERVTYTLLRDSVDVKDPIYEGATHGRGVLTEILYPALAATAERYSYAFEYVPQAGVGHGYLLARTLPTGARVEYHYKHYASGQQQPLHSELVLKYLISEGETYRWSYTRFGDGVIRTFDDFLANQAGLQSSFSNAAMVKVLDPFDNLTEYDFVNYPRWNCLEVDCLEKATQCVAGECQVHWDDGLLTGTRLFAGTRLIQETVNHWTYDGNGDPGSGMFRYRASMESPVPIDSYSVPINPKMESVEVITPGGSNPVGNRRRTDYSDWTSDEFSSPGTISKPKLVREYDGGTLYRETYTDYDPTKEFHDHHNYVEVRNAAGDVISRTDKKFVNEKLECQIRRFNATGVDDLSAADCTDDSSLQVQTGDIVTAHTYDATTGNRTTTVLRGGDDEAAYTTHYQHVAGGYLRSKTYGTPAGGQLGWEVFERNVDLNTGLVYRGLDSADTEVEYEWDELGRLTAIRPTLPERPTIITYPTIHETRVTQDTDVEPTNFAETVYNYDDLGRLVEVRKRQLDGTYSSQKTEYDIASRVTRRSNWVEESVPDTLRKWTEYDYTIATNPEPQPDEPENHPDPLGRIHMVTRPLGGTTETNYDGLTTTVTVNSIWGISSSGNGVWHTPTTIYVNDVFGRLASVDGPGNGADAEYIYDERDNLTDVRLKDDQDNTQTRRFVYDKLGRLRRATNPENNTVEYLSYDARGKLLSYVDAKAGDFESVYDAAGRLTLRTVNDLNLVQNFYDGTSSGASAGKLTRQDSYQIDGAASVLTTTREFVYGASDGSVDCDGPEEGAFGYKGLNGRLYLTKSSIAPWGVELQTLSCQNVNGLPYLTAYPDIPGSGRESRSRVASLYHNGALWEVHDLGRDLEYISDIGYSPGSAVNRFVRGNGMQNKIVRDEIDRPYRYQVLTPEGGGGGGHPSLEDLQMGGCSGGTEFQYCGPIGGGGANPVIWDTEHYEYDGAGNIIQIGVSSNNYYYDELNRLVKASVVSLSQPLAIDMAYDYDSFGNMKERSKLIAGAPVADRQLFSPDWHTNRLVSMETITSSGSDLVDVTYDENGNMTSMGSRGYTFDEQNRLRDVTDTSSGVLAEYDYDANGYRVRSVVDGIETYYFRDGSGQVLSEFQRQENDTDAPVWNKDYIYALGNVITLVKNDVPAAPTRPVASEYTSSSVTLTWNDVQESDLDTYEIHKSYTLNSGVTITPQSSPASVPATSTSFVDTWSPAVTVKKASYIVKSIDAAANVSAPSPRLVVRPDGDPPPKPTGLTAAPTDRAIRLYWDEITTDMDDDIRGYLVEREVSGSWFRLNTYVLEQPTFLDLGLTNGQVYKYRVIATDTGGRVSEPSDPLEDDESTKPVDSVPPAQPIGVTAEPGLEAQQIVVRWEPVQDPDLGSYNILRRFGPEDPTVTSLADPSIPMYVDDAALEGETYFYKVIALDTSENKSSESIEVSARPRHRSVDAPALQSAAFEVLAVADPPGSDTDPCDVEQETNDIIQVRVTWTDVPFADEYRIYRKEGESGDFEYLALEESGTTEHLDLEGNGYHYTYYITTIKDVNGVFEESEASNQAVAIDTWPPEVGVRNVMATDSRHNYPATIENRSSRYQDVEWSRFTERRLVGYHVYRKCEWRYCNELLQPERRADAFSCEPTWSRLTDTPITGRSFRDDTIGGFKGCYVYAVRPVGPDLEEAPTSYWLNAENGPGDVYSFACDDDIDGHRDDLNAPSVADEYFEVYGPGNAMEQLNAETRGTADPSGPPIAPVVNVVDFGHKENPDFPWMAPTLAAQIYWTQHPASDLAGYHVEMAGSYEGPWKRITKNLVAWWETHYTAQGLGTLVLPCESSSTGEYSGHDECIHFRVIAVDEDGNESPPGYPAETWPRIWDPQNPSPLPYPLPGCPETPPAPDNLRASTETPGDDCGTRLEWDPVVGAAEYNIYRFSVADRMGYRFYRTHSQPALQVCSGDTGVACSVDSDCSSQSLGSCIGGTTYVERGDADVEWLCSNPIRPSPNDYCPDWGHTYFYGCPEEVLDAYYVTARGGDVNGNPVGGESPRSDIVFWDCTKDPGYAWLQPPTFPEEEFAYASLAEPPDYCGYDVWPIEHAEMGEVATDVVLASSSPLPQEVSDLATTSTATVATTSARDTEELVVADLVTLGQVVDPDPPWILHDLHTDHLGSVRLVTDDETLIVSQHDYLPFGEEMVPMVDYNSHMFTGHERDRATGLDYMLARYYGSSLGRFMNPDPLRQSARRYQPQTWNRYSYVLNNPLVYVDPRGLAEVKKEKMFAHGSNDETSAEGSAGVFEGTVEGEAGTLEVDGLTVEGEAHSSFEDGVDIGSSAEAKVIGVEGEASAFDGALSAEGEAKGMAAGAEVELKASKKGASAGVDAEAAIVSGEVSGSVKILGIEFKGTVGGGVGAAAGAKGQIGQMGKKGFGGSAKIKFGAPLFGSVGLSIRIE